MADRPAISTVKSRTFELRLSKLSTYLAKGNILGILLSALLTALSLAIAGQFGGPVMLYALVLGCLCHPLSRQDAFESGINFSANQLLKIGVALLGVKITLIDITDLGYLAAGLVILCVAATLIIGTLIGRVAGLKTDHSILSAGSVAICGASAALAIASVLPQNKDTECNTIMTVIVVTTLSTLAMVLYPLISTLLNFSDTQAGLFMGLTIHNVAQVVGAGFMISDPAGEISIIVKLMRVACLLPAILIISAISQRKSGTDPDAKKPPLLPAFMIGFILLMLINSLGIIPAPALNVLSQLSSWALIMAVAALGVKTSIKDIIGVGFTPIFVLTGQTLFLAVLALGAILIFVSI